ncbi:hypothetical protein SAMN05216196_1152 [Lutimaribacter pacificus]|uniref:Polyvalent protein metallopeptidase domain-containing protein n=1 Tax=Lutimaribacter pacificus TaxID=391948 RepID=A0A1H0NZ58_9RHOB|nr:hypothetical protein SAMN05216196_1152 [Lutimaribacter pacificus]SHK97170.1 hypothetical protein SAMN05444142_1151 [Lutimaribacter pacificus]
MTKTVLIAGKFQNGAGLSGYVAELGAAFLCADLGLTLEDREDHAAYIGSWLKVLKDDKRAIFTASAHAQRAADFLHGLQPLIDEDDATEVAI